MRVSPTWSKEKDCGPKIYRVYMVFTLRMHSFKRIDPAKTGLARQIHQTISPCERMRSGDETRPWATIGCEIFMSWNHRDVYHTHLIHSYHIRQKWTLHRVSLRQFELARATFVKGLGSESWDIQLFVDREGKEFTLYVECIMRSLYTSTHCLWLG